MQSKTITEFYANPDRDFETYRGIPALSARGVHEEVVASARNYLKPKARVLDVGCGRGALALRLHDQGYDTTACDVLDHCQVKDKVRFVRAAAEDAVFEGPYDAVFMVEFLIATESPYALIRKYSELIRPGGHLIISTVNVDSDRSRAEFFLRGRHDWFQPHNVHEDGALSPLFRFQVEYIFGELGFVTRERRGILLHEDPPMGVTWTVLKLLRRYQKHKGLTPEEGRVVIYVAEKAGGP